MKGIERYHRHGVDQPSFFNVKYGKSSMSMTGTAAVIIATTQAAMHGFAILTVSGEACTLTVYDSTSTAAGNVLGQMSVVAATGTQWDMNTPVMARYGLVAIKTGTASKATVFFGPKG